MKPDCTDLRYLILQKSKLEITKVYNIRLQIYEDKNSCFFGVFHNRIIGLIIRLIGLIIGLKNLNNILFFDIFYLIFFRLSSILLWNTSGKLFLNKSDPEAEFKEFGPRLKFETRLKNGWFLTISYSMFQDTSLRWFETGFWRIWDAAQIRQIWTLKML